VFWFLKAKFQFNLNLILILLQFNLSKLAILIKLINFSTYIKIKKSKSTTIAQSTHVLSGKIRLPS